MTAEDFRYWRFQMRLNKGKAAVALGASRNSINRWETGKSIIPKYIGLACMALYKQLPEWKMP